jgi:hypothetical protein
MLSQGENIIESNGRHPNEGKKVLFPAACCPRVKMVRCMTDTEGHFINGGSTADPCSFVPWYILFLFMGEHHIRGTEVDNTVVREGKKKKIYQRPNS